MCIQGHYKTENSIFNMCVQGHNKTENSLVAFNAIDFK